MIYQRETVDAVSAIMSERTALLRREVKKFGKIRGKQKVQWNASWYAVDDYYDMLTMAEWEMTAAKSELIEKLGGEDNCQSQQHIQKLMVDADELDLFIKQNFEGLAESVQAEGMTSAALAKNILEIYLKESDSGEGKEGDKKGR